MCRCINYKKAGKDRKGQQRFKCLECGRRWTEVRFYMNKLTDEVHLKIKRLLECGCTIREVARQTGVHKRTIEARAPFTRNIRKPFDNASASQCDMCGDALKVKKEFYRRTRRTNHKFCSGDCYQDWSWWKRYGDSAEVIGLVTQLRREIQYVS